MKKVLFVCTGNICRSPMAEGFFRELTRERGGFESLSAGLAAMDGQSPSTHSVTAMSELGLDISDQSSQQVTPQLVEEMDYIFGLSTGHVENLVHYFPQASEKIFLLREFVEELPAGRKDIADPIGGSLEVYQSCRDEIKQGVESILSFITQQSMTSESKTTLAISADHGGFELKEAVKAHLAGQGVEVQDYGTASAESCDYPDFAQAVAQSVASGQHAAGILICKSGIGMSIAANKVAGVRAALVADAETAANTRQHNNSNVLCLGANQTGAETAKGIVEAFVNTAFEGGRHTQRVDKLESAGRVEVVDPDVDEVIRREKLRQQENIELIASENFTSPAVMQAQGSVLTNKYAEGYPAKRWYGGCEHVDVAEQLAIERAKQLFGAEHANVQPHSGSGANMAVYFSALQPGDKILTMDLSHGGHLTHGNKANFSGRFYAVTHYGVNQETEQIDYDKLAEVAAQEKPAMITVGASAYPRIIDFERMGQIAHGVGALLLADIAHIAGLVAAGLHPSPVGHADFVTTTTHKTLRGPRGGLILCGEEHAKAIDSQTFPGIQGGPLMHVIAGKAVAFAEALRPDFKAYAQQVVDNARTLAEALAAGGVKLVSGGTDNHLMLVDVTPLGLGGKLAEEALDRCGITCNKNMIPYDERKPVDPSGIRLGTPALTTRGMGADEMRRVADWILRVLKAPEDEQVITNTRREVAELAEQFPVPAARLSERQEVVA